MHIAQKVAFRSSIYISWNTKTFFSCIHPNKHRTWVGVVSAQRTRYSATIVRCFNLGCFIWSRSSSGNNCPSSTIRWWRPCIGNSVFGNRTYRYYKRVVRANSNCSWCCETYYRKVGTIGSRSCFKSNLRAIIGPTRVMILWFLTIRPFKRKV